MPRNLPHSRHLEAAAMLARDVPVAEVARQMGVTRHTIQVWAKTEECQAHIAAIKTSVREATKHLSVADKVRRLVHAQEMVDGIESLIAARRAAGEASKQPMPGEATGHVAIKDVEIKGVRTREAAFDAALHNEKRKWLEYAAKELGEFDAGLNVKHSGRVDHIISRMDLGALTDEELESLLPLAEKVAAGELEH